MTMQQMIQEAAEFVRSRGFDGRFDAAFVLGTGLGHPRRRGRAMR